MRHCLSEKDYVDMIAVCSLCGPTRIVRTGEASVACITPRREKDRLKKRPYAIYKSETCDRCGFVPEDECQLDVDHIDGDHQNNDLDNLQTLCANCHRLKSKREQTK